MSEEAPFQIPLSEIAICDMTEPELRTMMSQLGGIIDMLLPDALPGQPNHNGKPCWILHVDDGKGVSQYVGTVDPQCAVEWMRECALRIEARAGVPRETWQPPKAGDPSNDQGLGNGE